LFGLILLFPSLNKKYFYGSNYIDVKNFNLFKNFLLGLTFGFGFTPCIGPVLGALLTLSSSTNTIREGVTLLIFYSVGLAIPFILMPIFSSKINLKSKVFVLFQKYSSFISGSTLIAIGILIFTDRMYVLASFFQELFVLLNLEWLSTI
jgi:cytochrome c-type biogenesis protein